MKTAPGEDQKIGVHVRTTMKELASADRLSPAVVGKLLDARYCKATFNLGLPFLKVVDPPPIGRDRDLIQMAMGGTARIR
jgi:hypothetical protein